jgi:hypothetical protein
MAVLFAAAAAADDIVIADLLKRQRRPVRSEVFGCAIPGCGG